MPGKLINFEQILGQEQAVSTLSKAYLAGRLPHGLIFAGPVGVGKGTTAEALAGLFLCEKPNSMEPCGACPSCRAFDAGNHPDYHIVYRQLVRIESQSSKARDLSVDVVRDYLIAKAAHKSVVGVGKVFVIEEADLMNAAAQNSLLKTLEEPAGRTLIILLTDQPDQLLATIRSRCQMIRFAALSETVVGEQLLRRGISRDAAAAAARHTEGSLGLALKWLEDGVIERAESLEGILARLVAGSATPGLAEWFRQSAEAYAERQLQRDDKSSKDQATREGLALYLRLASQFFRRRLAAAPDDQAGLQRLCDGIDAVVRAEGYLDANVNIPLVLQQFASALERVFHPRAA